MHQENEQIQLLSKMGFPISQARIFLTLSELDEATANEIAKTAKMDRAETYRILGQLHEMGFVKKRLSYPGKFVAIPIKDLLEILIKCKQDQIEQIEREAAKLFQHFSNKKIRATRRNRYTSVVHNVRMITKEIRDDNRTAKKRIDILTSIQDQEDIGYNEGKRGVETSLKNGVKIRLLIEKPSEAESMPKHISELAQYPNFILRYIHRASDQLLVIQDDEKVWIKMGTNGRYKVPWLISNNPAVIILARAFFDKIFEDSTPS